MSITYTWRIANLERHAADGVVYTVHWTCSADDGTSTAGSYGSVGLEAPTPGSIIPFDQLNEQVVIGWTKDRLGAESVAAIEQGLADQLSEFVNPTTASGVPWADNATTKEQDSDA